MKPVHVFIINEFDTLVGTKGLLGSLSETQEKVNAWFLEMLQPSNVPAPSNIVIIATSNFSPSAFNEGLMRDGRFGLHLKINNPDQDKRVRLLKESIKQQSATSHFPVNEQGINYDVLASLMNEYPSVSVIQMAKEAFFAAEKKAEEALEQSESRAIALTMKDFNSVLCKAELIEIERESVLGQFPYLGKVTWTHHEQQVLATVEQILQDVQEDIGQHKVVVIHGEGRVTHLCHEIIKTTTGFHSYRTILESEEPLRHIRQ